MPLTATMIAQIKLHHISPNIGQNCESCEHFHKEHFDGMRAPCTGFYHTKTDSVVWEYYWYWCEAYEPRI